jgi:hypothetical protein
MKWMLNWSTWMQEFSHNSKRIHIAHKGPWGSRKSKTLIISYSQQKLLHYVELGDMFPKMQTLPQTEFVCKSYDQSKFKSNREKFKVKKFNVTRVTTEKVKHGMIVHLYSVYVETPWSTTWNTMQLTRQVTKHII